MRRSWIKGFALEQDALITQSGGYRVAHRLIDENGNFYIQAGVPDSPSVNIGDQVYLGKLMNHHHGVRQEWRLTPIKAVPNEFVIFTPRLYYGNSRKVFVKVNRPKWRLERE